MSKNKKKLFDWLWETWCVISIIGIWPRFIEPRLLSVSKHFLQIPNLPKELDGLKIVQFSDLHWHSNISAAFLKKLANKINCLEPDFLFFTGDFLSRSNLEESNKLLKFLSSLKARSGCFAILGNHDYQKFITVSEKGDYDVETAIPASNKLKGFKRLFSPPRLSQKITHDAQNLLMHDELITLLKQTPFHLLHNEIATVPVKGSYINIVGLGEYMAGKADPTKAFQKYQEKYPGIVLVHNPDMIPRLSSYPGHLILSGHTHGGQVNLPILWKRLTCIEHPEFKHGLKKHHDKWAYINRGVGSIMPFRWFAMPELTYITLKKEK